MSSTLEAARLGRGGCALPLPKFSESVLNLQTETAPNDDVRTVLLIDPVTISRESLKFWLQAYVGGVAIAACANALAPINTPPRIILLHTHSLRVDDPVVLAQIAALRDAYGQPVGIAIITDRQQGDLVIDAIHRGSLQGYIPTSLGSAIVAAAIQLMMAGGIFVPPELITKQPDNSPAGDAYFDPALHDPKQLTSREAEVLQFLRRGRPNKLIAFELAISESTVKVHIRNIMRKMNVTNRTQVALLIDGNPEARREHLMAIPADPLQSVLRQLEETPLIVAAMD